ncbi:MAG: sodium/proline symporter PutP [Eubacteriaceae bacterium]|jgi:sodium/proline symporter
MTSNSIAIFAAFAAYLIFMIVIGYIYMKKTSNSEDYFLGGRNLNGWVAALSAQASDMSSWLLMGLPGTIYALGTGQIWIAVGLLLGTIANWLFISNRLRSYTIKVDAMTIPEYYEKRFHDEKRVLLLISSIIISIFFLVYTASAFTAGGKLFTSVFGLDYHTALTIGAVVILAYTFMGGFMAVCVTDFVQGSMMFLCLLIVPILAWYLVGDSASVMANLNASGVTGGAATFLNPLTTEGTPITFTEIISQLAWGLGYFGMPHILVRFMAIKNKKELKKSKVIAIVWVVISLTLACIVGVIGRAYLYPEILGSSTNISVENVFIEMIGKIFTQEFNLAFLGGLFLCGILAAIMSTADSQLLVTASSISSDLYKNFIHRDASDKQVLNLSRIVVLVIAALALWIAWDPNNSIMGLVSNAWSGLGSAFGPITLLSLYWKRTNLNGAIAGILSGGITVLIWDYIPMVGGQTLGTVTGLYSLVVGFLVSTLCIVIFSLTSKEPSEEMLAEYSAMEKDAKQQADA